MGSHWGAFHMLPPRGIKNFADQKSSTLVSVFEIKKIFSSEDIKEKETQMGPHKGAFQ